MRTDSVVTMLRERGHRITPQREAIVSEVLAAKGHFTPQTIAGRVQRRMRAVNDSTVYRTLELLEDAGVITHSHVEAGAEYHRAGEGDHVHLSCTRCGSKDDLSIAEADELRKIIHAHKGFFPDLTHFAISGLCAKCQPDPA